MKIVWDMTHAGRIKGGTGVYAKCLLKALKEEESIQVTAVSQPGRFSGGTAGVLKLADGLRQVWWTQLGLMREARRHGADILHAPAFVSSLFLSCPLVVTIHDLTYLRYPKHCPRGWLFYLRHLVPAVVRRAKAVLTDSHNTKKDVMRYFGTPSQKVHVVYLGVDSFRFKQIADRRYLTAIAERYGLNDPFVLCTGALAARKNIPKLVEAMGLLKWAGRCPAHQLVLVGEEPPGLKGRSAIVEAVERWGLEREVVFLGHVSDRDLPALYNLAGLLVMPSLYEGFGLPLLEAMACGTPVVASNTSSIPEVVGDAGLLFPPWDTLTLSKAIEQVLINGELRRRLVERGLKRAGEFTWERTARETVKVYRHVLTPFSPQASTSLRG